MQQPAKRITHIRPYRIPIPGERRAPRAATASASVPAALAAGASILKSPLCQPSRQYCDTVTVRATMACITAGEIEQIARQHAAQMAAKRKQRSSWTPTGRASEEAIVEVELARRGLGDVSALGEFPGLGRVDISGNCLADLSGLSRCVELRWVKASANRLASTAGVGDATKLKALLLDHNII